MIEKSKPTILIDLDGVLNKYKGNYDNNMPEINKDAIKFLEKLHKKEKYNLVLFTTRNLLTSAKWLIENKIDKYFSNITNIKLPSVLLIDDRAICFKGDFDELLNEIEDFKVWWT
ncbi:MAG: hypothetical protein IJW73_08810 [Candidatus Gastranaerophilales bacterium]|nr:hypothetical protein [Candidatus Gastranaerophilales bacterium]